MAVYRYPPEVHEFVKEWSPKLRDRELAEACNRNLGTSFTAQSMKAFRGNHGYRNGKKQLSSEEYWKYQTTYPQGMYEFIRDNSWGVPSKEMAEIVNEKFGTDFTPGRMKMFRQRHGIKSGVTGWYQKGHPPGNKGKKLEDYIDDPERVSDIKQRISATQFKKGERPANELPVGSVVVNVYGYKLIKVSMEGSQWERWAFLHRHTWEQHYGPIPEGMIVSFRDSDKSNCSIENLMLLTKEENRSLNSKGLRSHDPELTDLGLATVRLTIAAKNIKKKGRKEDGAAEDQTEA